jgi:hypothetical protein
MTSLAGRSAFLAVLILLGTGTLRADEPPVVRSQQSGDWSAKETWDAGRVPQAGDRVIVRQGHHVKYDVESSDVIRLVQIAGTLEFARDRNTRLEAGLVTLTTSEVPSEAGFDCHAPLAEHTDTHTQPQLLVGTPDAPIPADHTATIRLHYVAGMDPESCPAILCCGGRMEFHGAPIARTWVKLKRTVEANAGAVLVMEPVNDWKVGDMIIVTSTKRQLDRRNGGASFLDNVQTEERRITSVGSNEVFEGGYQIRLDRPLTFSHYADDKYKAEVALLTRNVVVESANPEGVRGHTMFHRHSAGSIGYAEFRHLGKKDVLGRYSLHFHECGQTMRGSSVIGASIWDSHNRWLTIHGTDYLVVRDCVGYKSIGHGFFLEDGSETSNILDHNLAAVVGPGKPLPKQLIPFDPNRGAGFWWANSQNSFTRNVAVECAEYGYRFDCKKTDDFDPVRQIRQPDGTTKVQDTRVMPFIRFQDNEAHTMRFFCLNLRGATRQERFDFYEQNKVIAKEAAEAMPGRGYPFWIRDFKCWEANWSVHLGTTGVFIDGLDSFRLDVAIWRSIMDRSGFRRMTTKDIRVNDIHSPVSMGMLESTSLNDERLQPASVSSFKDDQPPVTVITHLVREGNIVHLRGATADASDIKAVHVNDKLARSVRGSFAEWEISLDAPADKPFCVFASSEDAFGNVENSPHLRYAGVQVKPASPPAGTPDARITSDAR